MSDAEKFSLEKYKELEQELSNTKCNFGLAERRIRDLIRSNEIMSENLRKIRDILKLREL